MRLFVHHLPIHFISASKWGNQSGNLFDDLPYQYDHIFQGTGHGLVYGLPVSVTADWINRYFSEGQPLPGRSITWIVENTHQLKKSLQSTFEFLEAAGGLVRQQDQWLMIYRLGVWDFPKGKIETQEKPKVAASREVWEECGVPCQPIRKIGKTWHTYAFQGKPVLKLTHWFEMTCAEPHTLKPQVEEDITEVAWCTESQTSSHLKTSYPSIQWIWAKYQQIKALNKEDNR